MNFDLYRTAVSSDDVDGDVDVGEASWELVPAANTPSRSPRDPSVPAVGFAWSAGRTLESISAFSDFLLLEGREDGFSQVWVLSLDERGAIAKTTRTEWPSNNRCVYTATASPSLSCVGANQVFETSRAFLAYSSLNCPRTVYAYDARDDTKEIVKRTPVLGFDGAEYAVARLEITARDGTKVPVSLAWKKRGAGGARGASSSPLPKDAPLLLTGYGSYGVSNDPAFAREDVPLMNRGVVVCVAHVRGGGEMGREWYEKQGKYLRKKNTFFDFVDVASALVAKGLTSPEKLAITGRSAGGLLVGASINLAPHLFKCAVAAVPFVDVMVSMCDASIPLTTGEWEEWGNPNEMKFFPYMLSYSPMENVGARSSSEASVSDAEASPTTPNDDRDSREGSRPELLVTAGLHDPRVAYWEAAKYAARMREATTKEARVLLKTDLDAGHFSASDRYKYFKEKALEHAFVLDSLGLSAAKPKWRRE